MQVVRDAMSKLPRGVGFDAARDGVLDTVDPSDVDTMEQVDEIFAFLQQTGLPTPRAALKALRSSDEPQRAVSSECICSTLIPVRVSSSTWTFVIGLEERHIPDRRSSHGPALAEELKVLLVMLSRARHGLVVTSVTTLDGRYGPYAATRSRWFAALDAAKPCLWSALPAHVGTAPRGGGAAA
jgi:DNA helicase-2/ATP-dependent DNA helicase PcrA